MINGIKCGKYSVYKSTIVWIIHLPKKTRKRVSKDILCIGMILHFCVMMLDQIIYRSRVTKGKYLYSLEYY